MLKWVIFCAVLLGVHVVQGEPEPIDFSSAFGDMNFGSVNPTGNTVKSSTSSSSTSMRSVSSSSHRGWTTTSITFTGPDGDRYKRETEEKTENNILYHTEIISNLSKGWKNKFTYTINYVDQKARPVSK